MPYVYRHPRPGLVVDGVIFKPDGDGLSVLLVERGEPPFEGTWATPGGFVEIDETTAEAVRREITEETGLEGLDFHRFDVFDDPDRDPRGRMVSVAFWALVGDDGASPSGGDDAAAADWYAVDDLPDLAFDHDDVVGGGLDALRRRARTGPVGRSVLDEPFSIDELHGLYTAILRDGPDLESFESTVRAQDFVVEADDGEFRFDDGAYEASAASGMAPWKRSADS